MHRIFRVSAAFLGLVLFSVLIVASSAQATTSGRTQATTVTLNVRPANENNVAPVAQNDSYTVAPNSPVEDTAFTSPTSVLANDNDANPGTMASPLATLPGAMTIAQGSGRSVYVSDGSFTGPITLLSGVNMYGGYSASTRWSRNNANRSTIASTTGRGVIATNIVASTIFDRFEVLSGNAPAAGANSPGENAIR